MRKKVLIVTTEKVMLDEYLLVSKENNDSLDILIIGSKELIEQQNAHHKPIFYYAPDFKLENVKQVLNGKSYDFVFSFDEKTLGYVNYIAKYVGAVTYNVNHKAIRDKFLLKVLLKETDVKVPNFVLFNNINELNNIEEKINYPCIVKPTLSYGSNGVRLVESPSILKKQVRNIFRINKLQETYFGDKNTGVLVEEFLPDEEYSVEIIWRDFKPIAFGIMSRIHEKENSFFPDYVYYIDPFLPESKQEELFKIAKLVGEQLLIVNGATHTEIRYKKGIPYVLENAVRPGGGGYLYKLFSKQQGINFFDIYYKAMTGIDSSKIEKLENTKGIYFFYSYPNVDSGVVQDIYFDKSSLCKDLEIISCDIFLKPGDKILPKEFGMRYSFFILGYFNGTKENFTHMIKKLDSNCNISFY